MSSCLSYLEYKNTQDGIIKVVYLYESEDTREQKLITFSYTDKDGLYTSVIGVKVKH